LRICSSKCHVDVSKSEQSHERVLDEIIDVEEEEFNSSISHLRKSE
jgi:hypothetical protein